MDEGPCEKGESIVSCLPHISCSGSPNKGDGSDLACRILAVELVQLQAIVHKAVQNYTKIFRQLFCRLFFCERITQVLAEKHSKYCREAEGQVV